MYFNVIGSCNAGERNEVVCPSSEIRSSKDNGTLEEPWGNERRVTDETKDHLHACGSWAGAMNGSVVRRVQTLAKSLRVRYKVISVSGWTSVALRNNCT